MIVISINSCSEKQAPEPETVKQKNVSLQKTASSDQTNFVVKDSLKGSKKDSSKFGGGIIVEPDAVLHGWKIEIEYVLHHYIANSEFGIWTTKNRQHAGSSGDPYWITKLNQLKSKWGFNYISAEIGNGQDITAIVNAGFSRTTNYMGYIPAHQGGRDAVANLYNGLLPSDYFWTYYTDEPYSGQSLTQGSFKDFRDYVKNLHPSSLFGFGETYYIWANMYTHNPYLWTDGYYHTNYHQSQVDFLMCTRYDSFSGLDKDQRDLWDGLWNLYNNKYARTFIAAHKDGSEFRNLLGYYRNHGIAPWFFQEMDGYDYNDQMIESYCNAAWLEGFLTRYDSKYEVWYRCILNHVHDPEAPWECYWVEDHRNFIQIVQR